MANLVQKTLHDNLTVRLSTSVEASPFAILALRLYLRTLLSDLDCIVCSYGCGPLTYCEYQDAFSVCNADSAATNLVHVLRPQYS